jgi:hypothetical protein
VTPLAPQRLLHDRFDRLNIALLRFARLARKPSQVAVDRLFHHQRSCDAGQIGAARRHRQGQAQPY